MIELNFTGICEDCPYANLELECATRESYYKSYERIWTVKCAHSEACLRAKTLNGGKTEGAKE